jgi:hypothetical protein
MKPASHPPSYAAQDVRRPLPRGEDGDPAAAGDPGEGF